MGTLLTIILAVIIFGVGFWLFFRTLKREAIEGTCASCGQKGSCGGQTATCSSIKTVQFNGESLKK